MFCLSSIGFSVCVIIKSGLLSLKLNDSEFKWDGYETVHFGGVGYKGKCQSICLKSKNSF